MKIGRENIYVSDIVEIYFDKVSDLVAIVFKIGTDSTETIYEGPAAEGLSELLCAYYSMIVEEYTHKINALYDVAKSLGIDVDPHPQE